MKGDDIMGLGAYFKSIIDPGSCSCCDLQPGSQNHLYMNPAAAANYHKYGGAEQLGKSLLDCHGAFQRKNQRSRCMVCQKEENNLIYTSHNEKQNKDVYMVALRDADKN